MYQQKNIVYLYDSSFEGFLCCVYESVYSKEIPIDIMCDEYENLCMFETKTILTNDERAAKVYASIPIKICQEAKTLVETVFFSASKEKEIILLRFLLLGYSEGKKVVQMVSHPTVSPVLAQDRSLRSEVHLLLGFLRFLDIGGVLIATISPQNFVLPFIRKHFCTRFANEDFLIFDDVHKAALIYEKGKAQICALDSIDIPKLDINEKRYQHLWKQFYNTITITSRENTNCRRNHCPKHFWANMCEMPNIT